MQILRLTVLAILLLLLYLPTASANSDAASGPHIRVRLVAEHTQLKPGVNWVGILLRPDPQWHTYWQNPGDSGEPPKIEWQLPEGITAGEIHWPLPSKIPVAHLVNYGYEGSTLLMVPITVSEQAEPKTPVEITSNLSWLVCKEDCIPGWATLSKSFVITNQPELSADAALFEETRDNLPDKVTKSGQYEVTDENVVVQVSGSLTEDWQLFPFSSSVLNHAAELQRVSGEKGTTLVAKKSDYFIDSDEPLKFLLSNGETGYYLNATLNNTQLTDSGNNAPASVISTPSTILLNILMAFAGGLILNLMPCVLPILSIKALSMQNIHPTSATKLAYAMGVIVSFITFAVIIIAFKHSGSALGWGFHMQSPAVVAILAFLFVFIAASLFDIAPAGNRLAGFGQGFIKQNGFTSQFATGVLAVIVASPCTAPFMAAALGIALVSSDMVTLAIFLSLGVGFALPLTLLFWIPALTRKIPKPGPWMTTFRQFLAFPVLATVAWLVWIFNNQTSALAMAALLYGLLSLFFALWLYQRTNKTWLHVCAGLIAVIALALPLYLAPGQDTESESIYMAFDEASLEELRQDNQVVLVNMTADWCITCKVNEQVAFSSDAFKQAIEQPQVHYMVGDWTNKDDAILGYLKQYQRSGVPLYVVYAGKQSYQVLPQILTTDKVIEAITNAINEVKDES